jgi:hypothetical protein
VFGGEPGPAATLAPKLGPLGLVITKSNSECEESWRRHHKGRRKMERYSSDGSTKMSKQSRLNHREALLISPDNQGTRKL